MVPWRELLETNLGIRRMLEVVIHISLLSMYRLPLIDTRTAVIPVATVPVGSVPSAVFAFLIAATTVPIAVVTIPIAAMAIPVGDVHVVTVPLAAVAVLAPPVLH